MSQCRPIRFFHRGAVVEVAGAHPTRSVLDWLREDARRVGTKEGCNEGDCGACTVVVGRLPADDGGDAGAVVRGLVLEPFNACLRFLPTLDGRALWTVEDLKPIARAAREARAAARGTAGAAGAAGAVTAGVALAGAAAPDGSAGEAGAHGTDAAAAGTAGAPGPAGSAGGAPAAEAGVHPAPCARPPAPLHPVQQAMVDCHGSQCGFCTPGFVMTLWAAWERHAAAGTRPGRQELADRLSGNLCRCTGYRPILDAGQRMFDLAPAPLDTGPAVAALRALRDAAGDATFEYAAPNPAVRDAGGVPRIDRWHAPRGIDALAALYAAQPDARLVAGATDVGLWVTKRFRDLGDLIHLGDCAPLAAIREDDGAVGATGVADAAASGAPSTRPESGAGGLWIGAAAPLEAAWRALARRHPGVAAIGLRFGSPAVRNAGTMGGNVANGSPIGDSTPVLLALDARLDLRRGGRLRTLALADFHTGYQRSRLEGGEFVQAIRVPPAVPGLVVRAYKVSKRFDCDISAVCGAFAVALDDDGALRHVRLAWGGMAATARRAATAEAALLGRPWDEAALRDAQAALAADFAPLDDLRASAAYRMQAAQNLLERFWLETRVAGALPAAALDVWGGAPDAAARLAPRPAAEEPQP